MILRQRYKNFQAVRHIELRQESLPELCQHAESIVWVTPLNCCVRLPTTRR